MTTERGRYRTRQRTLVSACLAGHVDRYLTVDEVCAAVQEQGERVGRTTVYRNLEVLVEAGDVLKATAPGGEASYRLRPEGPAGQLVCVTCGRAYPLECHMVDEFAHHVYADHGFKVLTDRTVLYGLCAACQNGERA